MSAEQVNPADIAMDWLRDNYGDGIPGVRYVDGERLYAELVDSFAEDGYRIIGPEDGVVVREGEVPPWMVQHDDSCREDGYGGHWHLRPLTDEGETP